MDRWQAFNQYQEQQRKVRAAREQELAEQRRLAALEAEQQQALREQQRREVEQRRVLEQELAQQQASEQQRLKEEEHIALLRQIARDVQFTDHLRGEALQEAALRHQEKQPATKGNPIEDMFYKAWCEAYPTIEIIRQHPIGRYKVDFAHEETKTVVEIDGYEYHHRRRDRNKDYARQHEIEDQDWYFVRFTGSQIFTHVEACIRVTHKRIMARFS